MVGFRQLLKYRRAFFMTNYRQASTIYALSSGYGKCGVSVIRVSGPEASQSLISLTDSGLSAIKHPRRALITPVRNPSTGELVDRGIVLWFPQPHSFTGEDCVEYQVHGSLAVVGEILRLLGTFDGHGPAEPGEFTKRAFINGKMDLTRVDGLADLIHSETEAQRKQAIRQLEGDLEKLYELWIDVLIKILSRVEALIDFSESEYIDSDLESFVKESLSKLKIEIQLHVKDYRAGERLRNGIKVVIIGKPNVGKSSLLNLLLQKPVAITSPIPGTTRDVLQYNLNLGGYPVILSDTAGLRSSLSDPIEAEGIRKAKEQALSADIVIRMEDVSGECEEINFMEWDSVSVIDVYNKIDLLQHPSVPIGSFPISVCTGEGIHSFLEALTKKVEDLCRSGERGLSPSITRLRYKTHCIKALDYIEKALGANLDKDPDIFAHYCRMSLKEIESIVGKIDPELIFDTIFADFCVGK